MTSRLILTAIAFNGAAVAERLNRTASVAGVDADSVDSSMHAEWLLDEALDETFPASDPISPSMIGAGTALGSREPPLSKALVPTAPSKATVP
jgi:hypothetical protein